MPSRPRRRAPSSCSCMAPENAKCLRRLELGNSVCTFFTVWRHHLGFGDPATNRPRRGTRTLFPRHRSVKRDAHEERSASPERNFRVLAHPGVGFGAWNRTGSRRRRWPWERIERIDALPHVGNLTLWAGSGRRRPWERIRETERRIANLTRRAGPRRSGSGRRRRRRWLPWEQIGDTESHEINLTRRADLSPAWRRDGSAASLKRGPFLLQLAADVPRACLVKQAQSPSNGIHRQGRT